MRIFILFVSSLILLFAVACKPKEEGQPPRQGAEGRGEALESSEQPAEVTLPQTGDRREFERAAQEKILELSSRFEELKQKVQERASYTGETLERELDALNLKLQKAQEKLNELKSSGEAAWKGFIKEVDSAIDDATRALEDFKKRFE